MMNEENKVMNALVNLMVCPRKPGSACCNRCSYTGVEDCYESLISNSMMVLNKSFMSDKSATRPTTSVGITEASDYETYVSKVMFELGSPAHVLGYQYARRAIILAVSDSEYLHAITGMLYPAIAKEYHTTASRVERAIRHLIEITWDRGDLDVLQKYFGNTISYNKGKPTNSEFIATMAEHAKLHFKVDSSK